MDRYRDTRKKLSKEMLRGVVGIYIHKTEKIVVMRSGTVKAVNPFDYLYHDGEVCATIVKA